METVVKGKVWKFGDDINTESIMPTGIDHKPDIAAKSIMMFYDPEFAPNVQKVDIVVTGTNFGNSSSRPACRVFDYIGVPVVVCESVARVYYMNSWNNACPCIQAPGISDFVSKGDILEVDIIEAKIKNLTTGKELQAEKPVDVLVERWKAGGLLPWMIARRSEYELLE